MKSTFVRLISIFSLASLVTIFSIGSAFAAESADVTDRVEMIKTEHKWFYWPGWAFGGLTLLVVAIILFSWWKLVLEPKHRGRKISQ